MSVLRTEGFIINQPTGLPVITGLMLTTESGLLLTTAPVGEPPGGFNSTPGTDPNVPGTTTAGGNPNPSGNAAPGTPRGFIPPVTIGPTS